VPKKSVKLKVEDTRPTKDMIGVGAKKDFEHYTGILLLYLAEGDQEGNKLGAYDLKSMFYEAFKRRLERAGIDVVPSDKPATNVLVIKLNRFLLDLVDRKWLLSIDYEAVLMKQNRVLFTQAVNGEAERLKVYGLDQANKIISELVTDVVNRPDLGKIFKKLNQGEN
jgi:hypothetical protein